VPVAVSLGLLAHAPLATAQIMPPDRVTNWSPGIPGGIPNYTTVCATVNAADYGHGALDATAGIQAAINGCPVGQVVKLSAGNFKINGTDPVTINKGIVLRGEGPQATKLLKTNSLANPLILIGRRWLEEAQSVNLTANVAKGATSVQVASTAGFSVGQLVLVDQLTDDSYVYWGTHCPPGDPCRGWFTRYDRPVGQMVEIASISGNTVSFTTALHISLDTAHTAQLTRFTIPYGAKYAGVEDLYVRGGQDDNITVRFAMYSWVRGVESDMSMGDSIALDTSFRCVLRDSYAHDTPNPFPGGAGYMLSIATYTSESLVENNIFIKANKVMVMRASGGGNVIAYNYFDDGYIGNFLGWMETGLNASHMTCPHFELFEGNQAFNIDGDDTWGGAVYNTYFRNHATGKRRSFPDINNRRAIGLMYGHYWYSFVGNVMGTADQNPAPYSGFAYEDFYPWEDDPIGLWRLGYTPENWNLPPEDMVVDTVHRHANWDYATDSVQWAPGYSQTLPDSLYLAGKPAFFGSSPWPWVDATGPTKLYTLPARARYDAGLPNPFILIVAKVGTGSGTVTSSPPGIACGPTCSASYTANTVVNLTASPAAGSTFTGWGGACSGSGACQVTMNAPKLVTATFTQGGGGSQTLTVTKAGTGSGTVTSSPAGIDCGSTCTASFATGTVVNLTASPAAGSTFTGWGGACSGSGACQVIMDAAKLVTATFTQGGGGSQTLTVTKAGGGSGTVTSSPAGISCGPTCTASFPTGTVVTLTASAAAGSTFTGWGGACSGAGACQVTMDAAKAVTATFVPSTVYYSLIVTKSGNGTGTVVSSPVGINCGPRCSKRFPVGTVVTLTATPAAGSTFGGWSGHCSGSGACQVTMLGPRAVDANFVLPGGGGGDLVAGWALNEGAGSSAGDSSGNGNTGTLVNGPTWSTGKYGGALLFDGSNDRVRVNDSPSLDLTTAATFEAWVYPTAVPSGWRTILQKEVDAYFLTASGGGIGNQPTSGGTFNGVCCTFVTGPAVLPPNIWTHVAATYDGAALRFYTNAVLVATKPVTGSFQVNTGFLWMGGNAVYGEHFKGKLDELRVYDKALTQAEIQADMLTPLP
jgi:hypothetical protein